MLIWARVLAIARVCVMARHIVRLAGTWAMSTVPQSTWPVLYKCADINKLARQMAHSN